MARVLAVAESYSQDLAPAGADGAVDVAAGLSRRGRRDAARLGLRVGAAHPVWLLLTGQGIDPNQLGEDLLAGLTAI